MNEELYQQHFNDMVEIQQLDSLSEQEVDAKLERLLQCVPNHGKLYKYRSIKGKAFKNAYDSLKKGYIWFARADTLNDDTEICINFKPEDEVIRIRNYIVDNPLLFLKKSFLNTNNFSTNLPSDKVVKKMIDCIDIETGKINKARAVSSLVANGANLKQALKYITQAENAIKDSEEETKAAAEKIAKEILSINQKLREMSFVYSMTEDFDSDSMWAYYSNDNKGFCVEYDLQKIKSLPTETKRKLLSLYKIVYEDKEEYSFFEIIKGYFEDEAENELNKELATNVMKQVITKKEAWKQEKEWRFYLNKLEDSAFPLDIVSGIIIDKRVIDKYNTKKLISLCKRKGWTIKVRSVNALNTGHVYEVMSY